jgi:hypothetical protein
MVLEDGELVAAIPGNKLDDHTIASHSGLSYGGFIFKRTIGLIEAFTIIYKTFQFLDSKNISKVYYKSFPQYYNTIGSDEISSALFLLKAILLKRVNSSVVNLRDKIEYQNRRIRSINKAKKLGVLIQEVNTFDAFWNQILIPNLKERFDANPTHSLDEITYLGKAFPMNIRQFNASIEDRIVAGTTIFETKHVAHVQYNSANEEGRQTGASDLLYAHLMDNQFKAKNYFDFGISSDGNGLNYGLLSWKEGFGARSFANDFYEIETKNFIYLKEFVDNKNLQELFEL